MKRLLLALAVTLWPALANAGLTEQQVGRVALAPAQEARAPLGLMFKNMQGNEVTLGDAIAGRPTLLLPADFTCAQICGPALTIVATALQQTGLTQGKDYSLVVVGLDAQDGVEAARRFSSGQVGGDGASVLVGDSATIDSLTRAIGYRFARDGSNDAFAHPAAFVTLAGDGVVGRAMSSLALEPTNLKLALIEAGRGTIGGFAGRIALLCYGFDAVHGIYTRQITVLLQIAGAAFVFALVATIGLLVVRSRKRGASA